MGAVRGGGVRVKPVLVVRSLITNILTFCCQMHSTQLMSFSGIKEFISVLQDI